MSPGVARGQNHPWLRAPGVRGGPGIDVRRDVCFRLCPVDEHFWVYEHPIGGSWARGTAWGGVPKPSACLASTWNSFICYSYWVAFKKNLSFSPGPSLHLVCSSALPHPRFAWADLPHFSVPRPAQQQKALCSLDELTELSWQAAE